MSTCFKKVLYLPKKPRVTNTGATNHSPVQSILVSHFYGSLWSVYIPIAKNRNMHSRVVFYLSDRFPVGICLIHLRARTTMNGNSFTAYVLQTFGYLNNFYRIIVPTQASLYGDGEFSVLYHGLGQRD